MSTSPSSSSICCCRAFYLHPTGQIPAYEWNFSDVNPPVHALGDDLPVTGTEQAMGRTDQGVPRPRLHQAVAELHLVDEPQGPLRQEHLRGRLSWASTISASSIAARPLPTGGYLEQADGTAVDGAVLPETCSKSASSWPRRDPAYEDMATKYGEQFLWIARAMNAYRAERQCGTRRTASTTTSLRLPDGSASRPEDPLHRRPAAAFAPITIIEPHQRELVPQCHCHRPRNGGRRMPDLYDSIHATGPGHLGEGEARHPGDRQ